MAIVAGRVRDVDQSDWTRRRRSGSLSAAPRGRSPPGARARRSPRPRRHARTPVGSNRRRPQGRQPCPQPRLVERAPVRRLLPKPCFKRRVGGAIQVTNAAGAVLATVESRRCRRDSGCAACSSRPPSSALRAGSSVAAASVSPLGADKSPSSAILCDLPLVGHQADRHDGKARCEFRQRGHALAKAGASRRRCRKQGDADNR